jgi:hypothetical protein
MGWKCFAIELIDDPKFGHSHVILGEDGLVPTALVWAHFDGFYVHCPTKAKGMTTLTAFLDAAMDAGMICHAGKLTPSAQESIKYTGLIFYRHAEPKLLIPEDKRSKAPVMIKRAPACHQDKLSCLVLAIMVGVLESLVVEATPAQIRHTYLWSLQKTLQPPGLDDDDLPYFSFPKLSGKYISICNYGNGPSNGTVAKVHTHPNWAL